MLILENTVLLVVDVQEKLARVMSYREVLLENLEKIIKGAQVLGIPILLTEQNPEGLGPTIPEIAHVLPNIQPVRKLSFSCCGNDRFIQTLKAVSRKQVLIAGIETHCLPQV